jgi:putative ABC transport system substrate-binding protein
MTRRRIVQGVGAAGLALVAGCGRLPSLGQPSTKAARIGVLSGGGPAMSSDWLEAFRAGMREHGYGEDRDLVIEYRFSEGRNDRFAQLSAELVGLPVDVIVAAGEPAIRAAKEVSATIPIVMAVARDPVAEGLVASLARPGGNTTGLSALSDELTRKRLELLKDAVPILARVGALGPTVDHAEYRQAEAAARALGVELQLLEARVPEDLDRGFEAARQESLGAVLVLSSTLNAAYAPRIGELAARHRLPAMFDRREFAHAGGLLAYGPDILALWRRSATYVDKILKGAKPADLPVEQPTTFDFAINLQTARALGLTIPPQVLAQATEVIQ